MELVLKNVSREFQDFTAVDDINFTMKNGIYGLLGVNGAGKTTLMRMICTLLKPTKGHIYLNGKEILEMGAEYRQILGSPAAAIVNVSAICRRNLDIILNFPCAITLCISHR